MMAYHREPVANRVPEADHMLTAAGMRHGQVLTTGGLLELGVPGLTRDRGQKHHLIQGWTNVNTYIFYWFQIPWYLAMRKILL